MNGDEIRSRLVLFVAIVAIVVLGAATAGFLADQGSTERPTVEQAHLQPEGIDAVGLERGGEIDVGAPAGEKTIVIDAAHANDVSKEELQPAVSALTAAGHTVEYVEPPNQDPNAPADQREETLAEALADADAFVAVEPDVRYTSGEADLLADFAEADGRIMFLAGPDTGGGQVLVADPMAPAMPADQGDGEFASVTSSFGIGYDTGYLYDMAAEFNYRTIEVTPDTDDELTAGVDRVVLEAPTQVTTAGQELLTTSESAAHSESREAGVYPVAVANDNAVAVGDTGLLTSENYNYADNEVFLGNVLEFLVSGNKEPGVPDVTDDASEADQPADEVVAEELPPGIEDAP